jgi:NAD(P)-dependent dehydrogenase (short-subunit alcohol dehydrogenase family)
VVERRPLVSIFEALSGLRASEPIKSGASCLVPDQWVGVDVRDTCPRVNASGLSGKRVLVVGASGHGTGAATAAAVKRLGGDVVLAARSARGLATAAEVVGEPVETVEFDMTDADAVEAAIASLGNLDHVAITADTGQPGPFLEQPIAEARDRFEKFWGHFHVARAAAPRLRPGGSIVFCSSIAALAPARTGAVLTAVNAAINGLTLALARELAPLRVNAVAPSYMLNDDAPAAARREAEAWARDALPVGRATHIEETAAAIAFLMMQPTTTAVILAIDGGLRFACRRSARNSSLPNTSWMTRRCEGRAAPSVRSSLCHHVVTVRTGKVRLVLLGCISRTLQR